MIRLHLLVIDTGLEAHALRSVAEYWRADVTVTWVGNSGQIVAYLSQSPPHDVIILSGHGDERGLLLPELAEVIRPGDFADFLQLEGNTVIKAC